MPDTISNVEPLSWYGLSEDIRETLTGKLCGLWGADSDQEAFDSFTIDKQQALLLFLARLRAKDLWQAVKSILNVYGEGGVGIEITAWPVIESALLRRKDFTRLLANHADTRGAFYEKGRATATLHLLYVEETSRRWYVHFDLYSPVYSPASAVKHFRYEYLGNNKPDWRMIQQCINSE
ncbi:MAG: hypothetical protein ABR501_12655 [Pyrinomonadaceae bacterium]